MRSKGEMVVFLPSKSRQVEHDDELDPALVRSAEVQQLLKFGAIGGLRAVAFLAKARDDLEGPGSADIGIGSMDVYRPNIDPAALVAIAAVTAVVGVAAAFVPARRAVRMDPLMALRHE